MCEVKDWPALAKICLFKPGKVARRMGIKLRCLEQFFHKRFAEPPLKMFGEWLALDVAKMHASGMVGKEILDHTGYKHQSSLTRALTNATGHGLRQPRKRPKIPSQSAKTKPKNVLELL